MADPTPTLLLLVERCIHAFERDGEDGLAAVLADAGQFAAIAAEHIAVLRTSGLLQKPELPERIGSWRVLKRLGTGGMGTVYLAEQTAPIARRVAIKVIRPGMDTSEILARFAIERKALALLDHRGIARILDAGSTPDGQPFLVMEYVAGQPIHRYCDERHLEMRQRLELFVQVCEAVQHAHQKGILHRDLKPSNILVADRDGVAVPVVIDFGVAKSVGGTLARATQLTLPGRLLGTPEYVSPEQATNEIDVDTRTDVYSLGVVLYELLTSTLPVDGKHLRSGDVARVLQQAEPQTPSTRITSLGDEAATVAARRRTTISTLRRALRGDLDWIVLKAIERDRNRRYGMPAELAADIVRHLHHEPVTAGAPGTWYRLQKFCARYRLQVSAAMVVLGALAAGLVISLIAYREVSAAYGEVSAFSAASTRSLDAALHAVDELVQVGDSDLVAVPHMEGVRRDLLLRSVAAFQRFLADDALADPRLAPRTLDALIRLGTMQSLLGEHAAAMQRWQEVERLLASPATDGLDPLARLDATAAAALGMAHLLDRAAEQTRPVVLVRRATEALRALLVVRPQHDPIEHRLQRSLRFEANLLQQDDPDRAFALIDEALALARQRLERTPGDAHAIAAVIDIGGDRAELLLALGKRDACLEAVTELRALRDAHQQTRSWALATAMIDIAAIFSRCERAQDTLAVVADVAPEVARLVADHPAVLAYRMASIQLHAVRGNTLMRMRDFAAALAAQREVRAQCEAALTVAPLDLRMQRSLAVCCTNIALFHSEWRNFRGEWDAAEVEAALQQATSILDSIPAGEPQRSTRPQRVEALRMWGILHEVRGDRERARADTAAAVAIAVELTTEFGETVTFRTRLAEMRKRLAILLLDLGRPDEARPVVDAAVADSATLGQEVESFPQWESRHRELLLLQVRVRGAAGDVDGAFAALADQLGRGKDDDWIGHQDAARAVARVVESLPAAHPARARFIDRGRELVEQALSYAAVFEARGTDHGTIDVMRGNTLLVARQLEVAAGDLAAAAIRASEVVEAYATAWSDNPSARGEKRVCDAATAWLLLLQQAADAAGGLAALDRLAILAAGQGDALAHAAGLGAAFAAAIAEPAAAEATRSKAVELLKLALAAGLAPAALQHERFAPLRGEPAFTALQPAASSSGGGK